MTLIELMTVCVVLGILASIAVPSYRQYLLRSQRTDAKTALLQLQSAQEKFYLSNNAYLIDPAKIATAPPAGLGLTTTSSNGYYSITVAAGTSGDSQTFVATATAIAGKGQSDDKKCTGFTIRDTGARGASGPGGVDYCWR
jgi:type IV pilus assembly protein PilE